MFLKLFGSIRNNGVPVTLKEYLDLLKEESKIQNILIVSFPHLKHQV